MKKTVPRGVQTWRNLNKKKKPLDIKTLSDFELLEHFFGTESTEVMLENVSSIHELLKFDTHKARTLLLSPYIGEAAGARVLVLSELFRRASQLQQKPLDK
jgi:hypothetical protein